MATALVADDDLQLRGIIEWACEALDLEIEAASDGIDALEKIYERSIDVVLLDVNMPRLDGLGVLKKLSEKPPSYMPVVLMVTAQNDIYGKTDAARLGAIDYVEKPFGGPDLQRRVRRALAIRELERMLRDAEKSLDSLRRTDAATGVGATGQLFRALEAEFHAARVSQRPLACVLVSDEGYNPSLNAMARDAGSGRLQVLATHIEERLRGADILFRVDAAEFVILLPGSDVTGTRRVVEKIREMTDDLDVLVAEDLVVAAAIYPHPDIDQAATLYRAANIALVQARSERRIVYFEGF